MNVNKTMLREFVDLKISQRKNDLYEEIKKTVSELMEKALITLMGDVSELEKVASRFEDLLTEKIHLIGADSVPDYSKVAASEANKLCKTHKYFLDEVVKDVMNHVNNPNSTYSRFKCVPLMGAFNELNAELQPKFKLYRDGLNTLKNELNYAIGNETTGKRAYNALVALGMDMKDLPEANPNLPAVTKLSIDVCILNGNCKEAV